MRLEGKTTEGTYDEDSPGNKTCPGRKQRAFHGIASIEERKERSAGWDGYSCHSVYRTPTVTTRVGWLIEWHVVWEDRAKRKGMERKEGEQGKEERRKGQGRFRGSDHGCNKCMLSMLEGGQTVCRQGETCCGSAVVFHVRRTLAKYVSTFRKCAGARLDTAGKVSLFGTSAFTQLRWV